MEQTHYFTKCALSFIGQLMSGSLCNHTNPLLQEHISPVGRGQGEIRRLGGKQTPCSQQRWILEELGGIGTARVIILPHSGGKVGGVENQGSWGSTDEVGPWDWVIMKGQPLGMREGGTWVTNKHSRRKRRSVGLSSVD